MSDYVEQQWRTTYVADSTSTAGRIVGWVLGAAVVIALLAFATRNYWYPYASQWW